MNKKLKVLIITVFMLFCSASVFAVEEYISLIYKEIDVVFASKSTSQLDNILSSNSNDKYYYLIENYTEKKIRRLIVNNDYDFAMEAIVIVIENNLDNEQAVEMYTVISEAYAVQQEHERQEELKRQQELARIEMEKEKKRASVEKDYISASKTQGDGAVYVSEKETKLTSYHWKAALGIVNLNWIMEPLDDLNQFSYGIGIDFRYEYSLPTLVLGTDIFAGVNFLPFVEDESKKITPMDINATAKLAFPVLSKKIFIKGGVTTLMALTSNDTSIANLQGNLYSPLIGIKIEKIKLGSTELDLGVDWYSAHLYTSGLKFAGGGLINLAIPYAELEKVKMNFNIGIRDSIFVKESGIENRASLILAIGVENVIK